MSIRLFLAIDLPAEARARVVAARDQLRRTLREAGMDDGFRWVAPENLHLTLRFLGDVPDDAATLVKAAMQKPLDRSAVRITLGALGVFPPRGRPRVLHVQVDEGAPELSALRDALDTRLAPLCRWERETRPFAPHLTLGRGRDRAAVDPDAFLRVREAAPWPAVSFDASRVTLFSSRTLSTGPEYTAEAEAALRSS